MVLQNRSLSQTPLYMILSLGVRQSMPMPPLFPNLDEINQVNYFTTSQPIQNAPIIHQVTQNVSHVFTVAPSKAPYIPVAHDATQPVPSEARPVSDELINKKLKNLEDAMRSLCGLGSNQSVRYEELCAFPEVELPPSYKIPKFEKFDGSGNPFFHLKVYCEKLIGVGKNEGIRIKLFNQILSGKALEW
ncbi:hypothetical protein RDI58_017714 [Solanum bulbocastanum]|uniref:Uncharacterized protein n=1 Tax=Solanum bulbocastanum TaxID=147425 RepID=A0AAN8TBT1_SOLBU